jgi:hypothetical protein
MFCFLPALMLLARPRTHQEQRVEMSHSSMRPQGIRSQSLFNVVKLTLLCNLGRTTSLASYNFKSCGDGAKVGDSNSLTVVQRLLSPCDGSLRVHIICAITDDVQTDDVHTVLKMFV